MKIRGVGMASQFCLCPGSGFLYALMVWTDHFSAVGLLLFRLFAQVHNLSLYTVGFIDDYKFVICLCKYKEENIGNLLCIDSWSKFTLYF